MRAVVPFQLARSDFGLACACDASALSVEMLGLCYVRDSTFPCITLTLSSCRPNHCRRGWLCPPAADAAPDAP